MSDSERRVFEYVHPQRFVVGTVGEPGQRAFYLQARDADRVTSVLLEKSQVAALAERISEVLDTLLRRSGGSLPIPAVSPHDQLDLEPLDSPIEEEFRVGTMSLAWDEEDESVVLEAFAIVETDDDQEETFDPVTGDVTQQLADVDVLRVVLSGVHARGFAERAERVVAAGRPSCPFCSLPLDPGGHICPRSNGFRRRL